MDFLRITEDSEVCKSSLASGNYQIEQFRISRFARLIADYIVNNDGDIDVFRTNEVIERFQIQPYGAFDALFPLHVKHVLHLFLQKKNQLKIRQLSFPLANKWVETLINGASKRDISVAIIQALLTFLRQSVGSCFATAPIIFMQTNDPEFLFNDLYDLITRGFLKRVIDGQEYKVPISVKTSKEMPLLKCYEYTVASFADWKTEFYKWNMYTSLGIDVKETGGIGASIYHFLEEKLQKAQEAIQKLQDEVYHAEDRYRTIEALFRGASSVEKAKRLEMEAKTEAHHYFVSKELLEEKIAKAEAIAKFYPFFIEQLLRLFPLYFQEVFDPDMNKESGYLFEDRPAGFRLMFKHGKSDPTTWTMIYNEKEYLKALEDFFKLSEADIGYATEEKELLSEVIDQAIWTLWEKSFLEHLMARIQKHPHKKAIKPWAYISGGNLESLARGYLALKNPLLCKEFHPETPLDLCAQLIEFMKDLPYKEAKAFEENPLKAMLMTSPTHAFLFKPGLKPFLDAWQDRGNTYTYVRDHKGPIPFADTNWDSDLFAFAINPHTNKLDLYRQGTFTLSELPPAWKSSFSNTATWRVYY